MPRPDDQVATVLELPPKAARLDKRGFADHLACSVSWIEKRMAEGMPCEEIAGRIKFEPQEAEEWLRANGYIKRKGEAA